MSTRNEFAFAPPPPSTTTQECQQQQPVPQASAYPVPSAVGDSPPQVSAGHPAPSHNGHDGGAINKLGRVKSNDVCRVCGDGPARMHYSVPTCFGCKGFFRRTLKRTKEYTCRYNGNCVVDRYERNSCRYCRFKRCLEVGMDPKAVRPDRDAAGRSHPIRHRRSRNSLGDIKMEEDDTTTDDWIRKLPVDMRTLLMQIMNMEILVAHGDTNEDIKSVYPLPYESLQQIFEDPSLLDGKRTEMRYEAFRQVGPDELAGCAHRRLIACIDTVDHLFALMDLHNTQDKIAVVKSSYAPLSIFAFASATAKMTKNRDLLCLCNAGYITRHINNSVGEAFFSHLGNRVVERTLDELVEPFRAFNFKDQEMVLMSAIVVLNPHIKTLSAEAAEQIADLRDRVQETLYNVVRESHPKEVASSRFGNLLLFLPTIMMLGNIIYENLQFAQTFGGQHVDPLLTELLDNIEPIHDMNGVNVEEVLSMADHSDQFIRSQSTSSISSLNSHCSGSSFEQGYASANENGVPCDGALHGSESDPDYNVTLTQERYADIRPSNVNGPPSGGGGGGGGTQPMDVDSCCGNSVMSGSDGTSPDFYPPKPRFYIESAGAGAMCPPATTATIVNGGHHVFTVEQNRDPMYGAPSSKSAHCLLNRFAAAAATGTPNGLGPQMPSSSSSSGPVPFGNGTASPYYNGVPPPAFSQDGVNMAHHHPHHHHHQQQQHQHQQQQQQQQQGRPLLYEDPNQGQQGSLSKSQSYPCYSYLYDDGDNGPPTLQAQQAFMNGVQGPKY